MTSTIISNEQTSAPAPAPGKKRKVSFNPANFTDDRWHDFLQIVSENFPHLRLHFEVALSLCGILGLQPGWRPVAVVFEGAPGPGKSLVLNCLLGGISPLIQDRLYRSDKFTPASFVSQNASIKAKDLKKVDLLPKIKNKVLITPELAPTFRGKKEEVEERFSLLARVLDGRGLTIDGGTHGRRGYEGDHPFLWLGATTHLTPLAFNAMASVGNRIFFFDTAPPRPTTDELAELVQKGGSGGNEKACTDAAAKLLHYFFNENVEVWTNGRLESVKGALPWPTIERREAKVISSAAWMIARLRAQSEDSVEYEYRVAESLGVLVRGRAAIEGYPVVRPKHLEIIRHIAISAARHRLRPLVKVLRPGVMDVKEVQERLKCSRDTALEKMKALAKTGICKYHKGGERKPSKIETDEEIHLIIEGYQS